MTNQEAIEELKSMYRIVCRTDSLRDTIRTNKRNAAIDKAVNALEEQERNRWIPCSERLPENAEHLGMICTRCLVMTKHGITVGWYNPDVESWYILMWFMTGRCLTEEISFERGDVPKVVKAPLKTHGVLAWMPLPEGLDGRQP